MAQVENGEILIAQIRVDVPGVRPEIRDVNGQVVCPTNLEGLAKVARETFQQKPWFGPLLRDVRQGKKSAIFVTVLGGITIFAATAAGFEFGIRHGQDLKHLPKILGRKKQ